MNILMILEHDYPEDERVTKEISTLKKNGHSISLACITKDSKPEHEIVNETEIIRMRISKFRAKTSVGALKFAFYFNFWSTFIEKIINKRPFDAIHIHDLPLAKIGYKISRQYNMKFILDLHENWPVLLDLSPHTKSILGRILSSQKQWLRYEKKYASLADGLVVVANEMKERLLRKGVKNNNIAVVPNTSNVNISEENKEIRPETNYITLYYAGGINKHRGLEIVVQGLSKMKLPENFRFWIIGKGKNEASLIEMVENCNLKDKVLFLGWKSHNEVLDLLFQSDIAIIPHLRNEHTDNTSPNKIFHYMLAKKPIISSDCKYLEKILKETDAGLIYQNDNPDDFVSKLSILMKNMELRKKLGENGFKAATEKYNWENTSKPLIEIYQRININDN